MTGLAILWVGAHPDDFELVAGGTFAKYARAGHKVYMSTVCNGDKGSVRQSSEEIARIRAEEMKSGAGVIGAISLGTLGYPDHKAYANDELVMRIMDLIRQVKADIVYTHFYRDYEPDHVAASEATVWAVSAAGNPSYKTDKPSHGVRRTIYADTVMGLDFEPDFWVDISETIDIKLRALACHKSQVSFMEDWQGTSLLENARILSAYRGLQSGVKYAEAFKLVKKSGQNHAFSIPTIE